jgi:hypothetical protein
VNAVDTVAWALILVAGSVLWASGIFLFVKSELSPAKKIVWSLFLVAIGAAVGMLLPLVAIRNRFLLLLAVLPVLAIIDVKLARSKRSFWFWFRACSFEICTVFGSAAITRLVAESVRKGT